MILYFNKIKLYNFGSYSEAEIDLKNKGFCSVIGQNNYIKDNSGSNGSGKSLIWSAICFALTGETINGVHSNLKNLFIEENLSYVELDLTVNNTNYLVARYIAPKSDLKIFKDGNNISGKTFTDSKQIFEKEFPDLTKDLISSTIILGQGLPNKFSSFTPSGRKELLEKLTKSDYMIDDVKNRLETRLTTLSTQEKEYSDSLLINNNTLSITQSQLDKIQNEYNLAKKPDFDSIINNLQLKINSIENDNTKITNDIKLNEEKLENLNQQLFSANNDKNAEFANLTESYNNAVQTKLIEKVQLENDIKNLQHEITHLKSITDTCPTCHQKLPNVVIQDTSKQEAEVTQLTEKLNIINADILKKQAKKTQFFNDITTRYENSIQQIKKEIQELKNNNISLTNKLNNNNSQLKLEQNTLTQAQYNKTNWDKYYENLKIDIDTKQATIKNLLNSIALIEKSKEDIIEHINVIKKISTLVSRDFRGYLLADIIKYIDKKAKDFCEIVFGHRELNIYLDKNNLDISYCGKLFDLLSGGEKQRCDVILQFAIRDLLQVYLGYSSNIIVLDEIFDNLDAQATDKILELISNSLKDVESVFIISHHSATLNISYDTELQVVKNATGISEIIKN